MQSDKFKNIEKFIDFGLDDDDSLFEYAKINSKDQNCMLFLAYYYYFYLKNYKKAAYWLRKVANFGNVDAMFELGNYYRYGNGVNQNYQKAIFWYKKAANLGDETAMNVLGFCYENGLGICQNYQKAIYWYDLAAKFDNDEAIYNLSRCYMLGLGVKKDNDMALKLAKIACDNGVNKAEKLIDKIKKT